MTVSVYVSVYCYESVHQAHPPPQVDPTFWQGALSGTVNTDGDCDLGDSCLFVLIFDCYESVHQAHPPPQVDPLFFPLSLLFVY